MGKVGVVGVLLQPVDFLKKKIKLRKIIAVQDEGKNNTIFLNFYHTNYELK